MIGKIATLATDTNTHRSTLQVCLVANQQQQSDYIRWSVCWLPKELNCHSAAAGPVLGHRTQFRIAGYALGCADSAPWW
jgi:hypothetical protein